MFEFAWSHDSQQLSTKGRGVGFHKDIRGRNVVPDAWMPLAPGPHACTSTLHVHESAVPFLWRAIIMSTRHGDAPGIMLTPLIAMSTSSCHEHAACLVSYVVLSGWLPHSVCFCSVFFWHFAVHVSSLAWTLKSDRRTSKWTRISPCSLPAGVSPSRLSRSRQDNVYRSSALRKRVWLRTWPGPLCR